MRYLQFTETLRFTKRAIDIIGEEGIARLQLQLLETPQVGAVVRASGGIRKMRFRSGKRGKSGGARVIYFFADSAGRIYLLDIYEKSEKSDLTKAEIGILRSEVEIWLRTL